MLNHFIHQDTNGEWHAVYQIPGSGVLSSVGVSLTKSGAEGIARHANHAQKPYVWTDPYDRPIPKGFYTDEDAK